MHYYFLLFSLLFSKIFQIQNIYNFLFIPFLSFLFLSRSSKIHNKKTSALLLVFFSIITFLFLLLGGEPLSPQTAWIRSFSIAATFLAMLGILPFDESLFKYFKLPLIVSLPAILFLFNPPPIYAILGIASAPGLFSLYSLVGIFPTSFYFAQILSAILIYKISPIFRSYNFKIFSFANENIERIILIFLLVLTNRKAFLIVLILYPISSLLKSLITIIKKLKISKDILNNLILRLILISFIFSLFYFGMPNITFAYLIEQILERLDYYTQFALAPWSQNYAETGMMVIYKYGGTFLFLISWMIFLSSFVYSLFKVKLSKISDFLIAYSLILLFLFKEAATVFSPSPSSLMLLMVVSMLINSSRSLKNRI